MVPTPHLIPRRKEIDAVGGNWILKNDKVIVVIAGTTPNQEAKQTVPGI